MWAMLRIFMSCLLHETVNSVEKYFVFISFRLHLKNSGSL